MSNTPNSARNRSGKHTIAVAAGCLTRTESDRTLVLVSRRRPDDSLGGKWEFPGGKIEAGESAEEAVRREVREEVGLDHPGPWISGPDVTHHYPHVSVRIQLLTSEVTEPVHPVALEVAEVCWIDVDRLHELEWPDANLALVAWMQERFGVLRGVSPGSGLGSLRQADGSDVRSSHDASPAASLPTSDPARRDDHLSPTSDASV